MGLPWHVYRLVPQGGRKEKKKGRGLGAGCAMLRCAIRGEKMENEQSERRRGCVLGFGRNRCGIECLWTSLELLDCLIGETLKFDRGVAEDLWVK